MEHSKNGLAGAQIIRTFDSDISKETKKDTGQNSEDRKGRIKNESLLGNLQNLLAGCTNAGKGMDDVSDTLQNEREIRHRETQPSNVKSVLGYVAGKIMELSIADGMEEMIKLINKQELLQNIYGIASNDSLPYTEKLLYTWWKVFRILTQNTLQPLNNE